MSTAPYTTFRVETEAGRLYTIQTRQGNGEWRANGTIFVGDGTTREFVFPGQAPSVSYRALVEDL